MPPTPPSGSSAAASPNTPASAGGTAGGGGLSASGGPSGSSSSRLPPNTDGNRVIRKRNRIPLSCAPCRSRKLKCNRAIPCENCVKRGDTASCSYATPTTRRAKGARGSLPLNPDDMQDRINRLEALVLNLVQDQGQQAVASISSASPMSPSSAARAMMQSGGAQELTPSSTTDNDAMDGGQPGVDSETERVANSLGVMHVNANKSMYIGNTHWAAVLADVSIGDDDDDVVGCVETLTQEYFEEGPLTDETQIQEVKNFFVEHKKQYEEQIQRVNAANAVNASSVGPSFLLYAGQAPNFIELLNMMPGKDAVDKLVDHYFDQYDRLIHIVHPPTWRRMYEQHWAAPEQTDPAFLAQIFAMMGISLQSYKRAGLEPSEYRGRTDALSAHYRQLTIQSFALVDFTKPSLLVIEAMVMHARGQAARSREADTGIWVLTATIVRIAMRMGLHRDPSHFGNIPPFMGEMRRRIWTWIRMSDTLLSQQVSLPCMVRTSDCDTQLPLNLYDEELDENMAELPPSRPTSQFTPMTYMIGKCTITNILAQIIENKTKITPTHRDEVERLDSELQAAYQSLPNILHPSDESFSEQPATLHMRFSIGILYHKSMCVLHREFLTKAREDERLRESRRRCIDSAMKLLQYQSMIYYEGRPGGRLPGLAYFDSANATPDFLLAATIVSLDVWFSAQASSAGRPSDDMVIWGRDRVPEMKDALENSRVIWNEQRNLSMEAYKASEIIGVMLGKVNSIENPGSGMGQQGLGSQGYPYPQGVKNESFTQGADEEKPEHTAAMTLGMLSTGMGQNAGSQQSPPGYSAAYPTPSTAGQTPGDLAAAAAQAAGFGTANDASASAQYADFFQSNMPPVNIDWGMWDSMLAGTNLEPTNDLAPGNAAPPSNSGSGNWQPSTAQMTGIDGTDIQLPSQTQELNTNLFANPPNMFTSGNSL